MVPPIGLQPKRTHDVRMKRSVSSTHRLPDRFLPGPKKGLRECPHPDETHKGGTPDVYQLQWTLFQRDPGVVLAQGGHNFQEDRG